MDTSLLVRCVEAATLAPSLHNSQPWRFRIEGDVVEVYADPLRRLDVLDPTGRELTISVGAAVFTLRAALRAAGWIPGVETFPDPGTPDLVARVRPRRSARPGAGARELAAAIPRRHTNRRPFVSAVVPVAAVELLQQAAAHEGATLTIAGPASRTVIVSLGRTAAERLNRRGGYFAELNRWTRPVPGRRDGVPAAAIGPWDAMERIPMRDFGLVNSQPSRRGERFEAYPTIAVLSTEGDGPEQWLAAGQAMQRVLLVATGMRLATTPVSQPVEIASIREVLSDPKSGRWAQMLIRLGYGPPAAATPRRPLKDVLADG
ncbi:Acg family FMN-binding oxidoreductase [Paractinoplanes atraurantiacus]|uniref:Nitroreductase family protein n=1 Tax=Paractinoplanes atraurantiacus TaxID=1036182 RepID=A0A285JFU5_9ACTN|nr:nitroreductase family protein [Actinoplanes atraurantiacus]SNY59169.1 Nitroreductase family protein [Actinoplanes atraurantiacus]